MRSMLDPHHAPKNGRLLLKDQLLLSIKSWSFKDKGDLHESVVVSSFGSLEFLSHTWREFGILSDTDVLFGSLYTIISFAHSTRRNDKTYTVVPRSCAGSAFLVEKSDGVEVGCNTNLVTT